NARTGPGVAAKKNKRKLRKSHGRVVEVVAERSGGALDSGNFVRNNKRNGCYIERLQRAARGRALLDKRHPREALVRQGHVQPVVCPKRIRSCRDGSTPLMCSRARCSPATRSRWCSTRKASMTVACRRSRVSSTFRRPCSSASRLRRGIAR